MILLYVFSVLKPLNEILQFDEAVLPLVYSYFLDIVQFFSEIMYE